MRMKNFLILLFIVLSLSNQASAQDNEKVYSFLGLHTAYSKYADQSTQSNGIKYGKQSDEWRTGISYNYATDNKKTLQSLIMQMDSGIFSNLFQNIPLKPYAGFALGAMQYENDKGYLYGVDGGLTYFLNDEIDIDLGYRFMTTSKVLTVDSIKDLTLSLHYFY